MADLPIAANRMNDVEITGNAPVTQNVMQKIGSNLNYLLQYLNISNGATTITGSFSDLANAVTVITANPRVDLGSKVTGSVSSVVTNQTIENLTAHLIHVRIPSGTNFFAWGTRGQTVAGNPNVTTLNLDINGGGFNEMQDHHKGDPHVADSPTATYYGRGFGTPSFSRLINAGQNDFRSSDGLASSPTSPIDIPVAIIDRKDVGTGSYSLQLSNFSGVTLQLFRTTILSVSSAGS